VLDDPLAGAILHRWREWGGPEEVDSWVTRVIATDDGMIQFLERSLMDGWSSREGRTYNIDFDSIKVFVNPDTLVARARALVGKEGPTTRQSKALQAFLKTLV